MTLKVAFDRIVEIAKIVQSNIDLIIMYIYSQTDSH